MSSVVISHRVEGRLEVLESQLRFHVERAEIRRAFMEEVERVRPQIALNTVRDYADSAMLATDTYPNVDPLLLLSVGFVESRYYEGAVSEAGARGLYQILPSTGRVLANQMGWDFDESMLFDPHANTAMAARYLSELIEEYENLRFALAAYNGGPRAAARLASKSNRLVAETRAYVPKVLEHYRGLYADAPFRSLP
jgi:soluble lytic murein transglycosylase-like protein